MDLRLPPRKEERCDDGLKEGDRMRDPVLRAVREQERGDLRIRGVVSSRYVEFEEVEYGERAKEEEGPPKVATMICKLRCEDEAYQRSVAQEEGA